MRAEQLAHKLTGLLRGLDIRRTDHKIEHAGAHIDIAAGTDVISRHAPEEREFFLDVLDMYLFACPGETPPVTIAPDELIRRLWSPRTGFVSQDTRSWFVLPLVQNALYERPLRLYLVTTRKERGVTKHTVE